MKRMSSRWAVAGALALLGGLACGARLGRAVAVRLALVVPAESMLLTDAGGRFLADVPGNPRGYGFWPLTQAPPERVVRCTLASEDARFADVFGPGSRAEAAVAGTARGLPAGLAVSGRVDRLLVQPGRVLVVDFKTNRPAPDRIEDADPAYLAQMAVYAAVLAEIFPGRSIEAALVWTDGPKLMPVSENIVAETLARLGTDR